MLCSFNKFPQAAGDIALVLVALTGLLQADPQIGTPESTPTPTTIHNPSDTLPPHNRVELGITTTPRQEQQEEEEEGVKTG